MCARARVHVPESGSDMRDKKGILDIHNHIVLVLQLCVWSMDAWEKQASKFLHIPTGRVPAPNTQTRVQFHQNQIHVLVVHETQIAIYEASRLELLKQVRHFLYIYILIISYFSNIKM